MHSFFAGTAYILNLICVLIFYFAMAFSLYRIAINNQVRHPWLAFVPILQYAIIGMLCEEYLLFGYRIRPLAAVVVGLGFLQIFSSLLGIIQLIINLFLALVLHKFYYLFDPRKALLYTLLSMLGQLPIAIILFFLKDKPVCMSAAAYPYPFGTRR